MFKFLKTSKRKFSVSTEMGEMISTMQSLSNKVDKANILMTEIKQEVAVIKKENEELCAKNEHLTKTVS